MVSCVDDKDRKAIFEFLRHLQSDPCPRDSESGIKPNREFPGNAIPDLDKRGYHVDTLTHVTRVIPIATALQYFREGKIEGNENPNYFGDSNIKVLFMGAASAGEIGAPSIYGTIRASTTIEAALAWYQRASARTSTPRLLLHSLHTYPDERSYTVIVTYRPVEDDTAKLFGKSVPVPAILGETDLVSYDPVKFELMFRPPNLAYDIHTHHTLNLVFDVDIGPGESSLAFPTDELDWQFVDKDNLTFGREAYPHDRGLTKRDAFDATWIAMKLFKIPMPKRFAEMQHAIVVDPIAGIGQYRWKDIDRYITDLRKSESAARLRVRGLLPQAVTGALDGEAGPQVIGSPTKSENGISPLTFLQAYLGLRNIHQQIHARFQQPAQVPSSVLHPSRLLEAGGSWTMRSLLRLNMSRVVVPDATRQRIKTWAFKPAHPWSDLIPYYKELEKDDHRDNAQLDGTLSGNEAISANPAFLECPVQDNHVPGLTFDKFLDYPHVCPQNLGTAIDCIILNQRVDRGALSEQLMRLHAYCWLVSKIGWTAASKQAWADLAQILHFLERN
ncbi:hypothetical protein HKX48_006003 [Thoreauomyces humboldtii]|nr:hypothetical protein HKX48_006003 [Thoreauomyces humboldtii]